MQWGTAARECGTRMEREVKERSVGGEQAVDWDEEETCGALNGRKMERESKYKI